VAARIPILIALVLLGSFAAMLPYLALSSLVRGRSLLAGLEYAANGVVWTAIGYCGAATLLAYVWGVYFLCRLREWQLSLNIFYQLFSIVTVVLFYLITLSRGDTAFPLFATLGLWMLIGCVLGTVSILGTRCNRCGSRPWNALLLSNCCASCGQVRLPRSILEQ
jgi:hypothetical protein